MHIPSNEASSGDNKEIVAEETISDVLKAMAVPTEYALGTLRLSFGRHTTEEDIDSAAASIISAVKTCWAKC